MEVWGERVPSTELQDYQGYDVKYTGYEKQYGVI